MESVIGFNSEGCREGVPLFIEVGISVTLFSHGLEPYMIEPLQDDVGTTGEVEILDVV